VAALQVSAVPPKIASRLANGSASASGASDPSLAIARAASMNARHATRASAEPTEHPSDLGVQHRCVITPPSIEPDVAAETISFDARNTAGVESRLGE
jgi:hypothetical protein